MLKIKKLNLIFFRVEFPTACCDKIDKIKWTILRGLPRGSSLFHSFSIPLFQMDRFPLFISEICLSRDEMLYFSFNRTNEPELKDISTALFRDYRQRSPPLIEFLHRLFSKRPHRLAGLFWGGMDLDISQQLYLDFQENVCCAHQWSRSGLEDALRVAHRSAGCRSWNFAEPRSYRQRIDDSSELRR